ncbi:MAG: hydrogenase maturation nickel metallochaperone HypA [Desulfovibrio sp.]|jgi:hydrogenase nickel incorporation protein HypA/HybF|nr:hydrogenase maturation nickel metallochaperone HypA [Desulfovibrio sp.]
MHEASLILSLLEILRAETAKRGLKGLSLVRLRCGALSNASPEALETAFTYMAADTEFAATRLELVEEPLRLACGGCDAEFTAHGFPAALISPCPECGEEIGHKVLAGRELCIDYMLAAD